MDYRDKEVVTALAPIRVRRAYYHCPSCKAGLIPKDRELDIVGTSLSPGVRRMTGRVGGKCAFNSCAKEPFEEGNRDLKELAGVEVKTKQNALSTLAPVERVSEVLGKQIEALWKQEREGILSGKVTPLAPAVPKLYIAIDGTGVPVVPHETEGRRGKDASGKAMRFQVHAPQNP